jgi:Uncharacterized protein conserved in bacteria (DUF2314)
MIITHLIEDYANWKLALLIIFSFAIFPQWVLRLLLLTYPRDDPRRKELLGELYPIKYYKRPFWVAEQFETALAEAIWPNFVWMLTGRVIHRVTLGNGVRRNKKHPQTFEIPSESAKGAIRAGDDVKLMFEERLPSGWGERMWVTVTKVGRRRLVGHLTNEPWAMARLTAGDMVKFKRKHVIDIIFSEEQETDLVAIADGDQPGIHFVHDTCAGLHAHDSQRDPDELPPAWTPPS